MAKRRDQFVFLGHRPGQITRMDQSQFWQRRDDLVVEARSADRKVLIDHLKGDIRRVIDRANWISIQVCCFMPRHTLHEEPRFLNVLAIMDPLIPDEVVAQLSPLDCALPILAACTHHLGMALFQKEHDTLFDESTEQGKPFTRLRTRFDEEFRTFERCRKRIDDLKSPSNDDSRHKSAQARKCVDALEGQILASHLRDTHAEDDQVVGFA